MLTKLILKTLDPELKVFVAAAEDMLSQAFKSTCGRIGLHSNFHEDTANLCQAFTSRLYCIKESLESGSCLSLHTPKGYASNKVSKEIQKKTHTATSKTTLPFIPALLWIPLSFTKFLLCRSSFF